MECRSILYPFRHMYAYAFGTDPPPRQTHSLHPNNWKSIWHIFFQPFSHTMWRTGTDEILRHIAPKLKKHYVVTEHKSGVSDVWTQISLWTWLQYQNSIYSIGLLILLPLHQTILWMKIYTPDRLKTNSPRIKTAISGSRGCWETFQEQCTGQNLTLWGARLF